MPNIIDEYFKPIIIGVASVAVIGGMQLVSDVAVIKSKAENVDRNITDMKTEAEKSNEKIQAIAVRQTILEQRANNAERYFLNKTKG